MTRFAKPLVTAVAVLGAGCFSPDKVDIDDPSADSSGGTADTSASDPSAPTSAPTDPSDPTDATNITDTDPSDTDPSDTDPTDTDPTDTDPSDTDPSDTDPTDTDPTDTDPTTPAACADGSVDPDEFCFGDATLVTTGNGAFDIALADLDGAAGIDIVTLNRSASTVSVLLNDGTGGFGNPDSHTVGDGSCRVRATDGDGDGDIDLVIAGEPIVTLDNDGTADFSRINAPFGAGNFGGCAEYNDLDTLNNSGGARDIVYSGEYNNSFVAGITNAQGWTFPDSASGIGGPGEGSAGVTVTEVGYDADDFPDVVVVNRYYTEGSIWRGNGSSGFVEDGTFEVCQPVDPKAYVGARFASAGDLDGNGQIDVAVTCVDGGSDPAAGFTYALGNDDGTFGPATPFLLPGVQRVIMADVDADGHLDLLATSTSELAVFVMRNDGTGNFAEAINLQISEPVYNVAVEDLNGDGAVDIAAPYSGGQGGRVAVFFADP